MMKIKANTKLLVVGLTYLLLMIAFAASAQEPNTTMDLQIGWTQEQELSLSFNFSGQYADKVIIIAGQGEYISALPQDGITYTDGQSFGGGEVLDVGIASYTFENGTTVHIGSTIFQPGDFVAGRDYWIRAYVFNDNGSPDYRTTNPGELVFVAPGLVEEPMMQPTNLQTSVGEVVNGEVEVTYSFDASEYALSYPFGTHYLMLYKVGSAPTFTPSDGSRAARYSFSYDDMSDGSKGKFENNITAEVTGKIPQTSQEQTVYFKIYAYNQANSSESLSTVDQWESINYLTSNPLTGSATIPARANTPPNAPSKTINIASDIADYDVIGNVGATDAEGDDISYYIMSGNTDNAFSIAANGDISVPDVSVLDFDNWTDYELELEISDGIDYNFTTITIAYNQPPVWNIANPEYTYQEERDWEDIGYSIPLVATDPDGATMSQDDLTFSIISGDPNDQFEIFVSLGQDQLRAKTNLDYETQQQWVLTVRATDEDGASADIDLTINITNINDNAPVAEDATFSISEEVANGDVIGTIETFDADGDDVYLSIIEGDESPYAFRFSGNDLVINNAYLIDFDNWTDYVLTVEARDASQINPQTATITINKNEPPVFTWTEKIFTLDEGYVAIPPLIQVSDPDQSNFDLTFTVVESEPANDWYFYVDANVVEIFPESGELDFEEVSQYNLTIKADDGRGGVATDEMVIIVNNLNDNTPVAEAASYDLSENAQNDQVVGTYQASDADGDVLTYSITVGNTDGVFSIEGSTGVISVANTTGIDRLSTPSYSLTVQASDGVFTDDATVTIAILEYVEEAPTIQDQTFSVAENSANGTVVGTVNATDNNGDAIIFSIQAGNNENAFAIGEATGQVTVANVDALDFETTPSFVLTVEASDGSLSNTATITVNLIDVLEPTAPEISDQTFTIAENSPNGTAIGTVAASDINGDEITFSITDGNIVGAFAIDEGTGNLTVGNVDVLDFETTSTFALTVEASDGALSSNATITINLTDVQDPVAPSIDDQTFSIEENSANGTSVGTIQATDANGDEISFSIISGNDGNAFLVGSASGNILVNNVDVLDFETTPVFSLIIESTDGVLASQATITINLIDLDDPAAPTISAQTFTIDENSANGTSLGIVQAEDANGDDITFSITNGNTDGAFLLGSSSGELLVANVNALDFEKTPTFELTIEVSDGTLSASETITVNLIDDPNDFVLSVDGIDDHAIRIYPNPASHFFSLTENEPDISIRIFNQRGGLVDAYSYRLDNRYPISHLPKGIYFMLVTTPHESHNNKIVID